MKPKLIQSDDSPMDCRQRSALGPKARDWLRTNIPPFKLMEAEARRLQDERKRNLAANGRTQ